MWSHVCSAIHLALEEKLCGEHAWFAGCDDDVRQPPTVQLPFMKAHTNSFSLINFCPWYSQVQFSAGSIQAHSPFSLPQLFFFFFPI